MSVELDTSEANTETTDMNIKFQTMREIARDLRNAGESKEERREAIRAFFKGSK